MKTTKTKTANILKTKSTFIDARSEKEKEDDDKFRKKVYEETNIETLILKYGGVKYLRLELERLYPNEFMPRGTLISMNNVAYSLKETVKAQTEAIEDYAKLVADLREPLYPGTSEYDA